MEINPADIRVDTYNTSNSGWFSNQSGVMVTHVPTGITARCGTERGQHSNRAKAFKVLLNELAVQTDFTKQMEISFD